MIWKILVILMLLFLIGCSHYAPKELDALNDDVQHCILSGGHPRQAPDGEIICLK